MLDDMFAGHVLMRSTSPSPFTSLQRSAEQHVLLISRCWRDQGLACLCHPTLFIHRDCHLHLSCLGVGFNGSRGVIDLRLICPRLRHDASSAYLPRSSRSNQGHHTKITHNHNTGKQARASEVSNRLPSLKSFLSSPLTFEINKNCRSQDVSVGQRQVQQRV